MVQEFTPQELGIQAQKEYTPEELGITTKQKEYTPEELGVIPKVEEPSAQQGPKTQNPFMGLASRAASLAGEGVEGVARVAENVGDYLESKLPISGVSEEDLKNKQQLQPLFDFAKSLKDWGKDIGYAPTTTLGELPGKPLLLVPFIAERIISSSPDMAAAMVASPAYITARTNEILNNRLQNDKKSLEDATVADVATSAAGAVVETYLERFATKGLLKGQHVTGATAGTRIAKEAGIQFGTEAAEEVASGLAETVGTEKGVDPKELALQALEAGIVGGGLGATVQGGKEVFTQQGQQAAPPPGPKVESAAGTPIPTMPLDTAEKQGQAQAAGQTIPQTPVKVDEKAVLDLAVELEQEYGIPKDTAVAMARQRLEGELNGRPPTRVDTGTSEQGVSLPSDGGTTAGGPEALSPERLASVSGPAGRVDEGEGLQPSALAPEVSEVDAKAAQLREAEIKLVEADTPEIKKEAQVEVNKARQELKKAEAKLEKAETTTEVTPVTAIPTAPEEVAATPPVAQVTPKNAQQEEVAPATETAINPSTKKWFGNSKAVDSEGKPLVLYRGLVGGAVDPFSGRPGYAIFTSDNPYIASSYAGDPTAEFGVTGGVVYPMYAKVDNVTEFQLDRNGLFDKFEFDKKARTLKPGEALVARNVMDTGPRMSSSMAQGYAKKSGDVWAFGNGTKFQSAIAEPVVEKKARTPLQKAQAKTANAESRYADKLISDLAVEPNNLEEAESLEQAASWDKTNKTQRNNLVEGLVELTQRPHKAAKEKAAAALTANNVTPEEVALAKDRIAAKKKANIPTVLEQHRIDNPPRKRKAKELAPNAKLSDRVSLAAQLVDLVRGARLAAYKTATAAIDHIVKTGNAFERTLAQRLKPFLKDVNYIVAQSEADLPDISLRDGQSLKDKFKDANGIYFTTEDGKKYLILRGDKFEGGGGLTFKTFLHEAVHGATIEQIAEYERAVAEGLPVDPRLERLITELKDIVDETAAAYTEAKMMGQEVPAALDRLFSARKKGGVGILDDLKEFVAYGMTEPDVQEFLANTQGKAKQGAPGFFKNLFTKFVRALANAFGMPEGSVNAFQDLMLVTEGLMQYTPKDVKAVEGAAEKLDKVQEKVDADLKKLELSKDATEMTGLLGGLARSRNAQDFNDLMNASLPAMGNAFITKLLGAMQSVDIVRWMGDKIPALKRIDDTTQHMSAMRINMRAAFSKKAEQISKFIRSAKNAKNTLADAMHLARLVGISPVEHANANDAIKNDSQLNSLRATLNDPNINEATRKATQSEIDTRTAGIQEVYKKWDALGEFKGGHDIYKMVRKFYKDNYELTRHLLDRRINSMQIEGSINDPNTPKGKLMAAVRQMQEEADKKGEYFPFMREGNYWLRVNGPKGREFYLFESGTARNLFLLKRARDLGVDNKSDIFKAGDNMGALRNEFSGESKMLTDMFSAIDAATAKTDFDKEALKDQLYQTYLMTLPEKSFRKQFLHADKVTGFSSDVLRNFKVSATRMANQAAKLRYGSDLENELQSGRDNLEGMPAQARAKYELFINEFKQRAMQEMNPPEQGFLTTKINQFAYYWLLTSAASAATQLASVPIMVMPTLNQQYGYGAAAKKFAKYANIFKAVGVNKVEANGDVTHTSPSIGSSSIVRGSDLAQRAFQEAVDRGLTTTTNTSILTNRNRTPSNIAESVAGAALQKTARVMSALFNGAERLSREMTYMMTFELEYEKTKDFEASVQKAIDTTQELLGRYDNFNRPRYMQNFVGKTLGQFKMYAVNMTSFFVRNMYHAMNVTNPKEMLPALHRLSGVLVMGGMFHGLVGMPLYSTICAAIDAAMDMFGDEEEKKKRRRKNPLTADNSDLRFRYEFLPKMFGTPTITGLDGKEHTLAKILEKGAISELTDMNIGSRTSFDGLWFRGAKEGKTALETVQNYVLANLGPGVSTGINMVGALDDFHNGQILRGLEKLVPAFFRGAVTAERLREEGATTKTGLPVLKKDEITPITLAAQTLGFQSTRLSSRQEANFNLMKEEIKASRERTDVLKQLDTALLEKNKDNKDIQKAINQIRQFNNRYPAEKYIITPDTITNSIKAAVEKRGLSFHGMQIDKKLAPYLIPTLKNASPK